MNLIPHKKLKGILTGNCSKCNYTFNIRPEDVGTTNKDMVIVCPMCRHREKLQDK